MGLLLSGGDIEIINATTINVGDVRKDDRYDDDLSKETDDEEMRR